MATKSKEHLQPIDPDRMYPVELLRDYSGLGTASFRELKRQGLDVRYVSGRAFVLGRSFIEMIQQGKDQKDGKPEIEQAEPSDARPVDETSTSATLRGGQANGRESKHG